MSGLRFLHGQKDWAFFYDLLHVYDLDESLSKRFICAENEENSVMKIYFEHQSFERQHQGQVGEGQPWKSRNWQKAQPATESADGPGPWWLSVTTVVYIITVQMLKILKILSSRKGPVLFLPSPWPPTHGYTTGHQNKTWKTLLQMSFLPGFSMYLHIVFFFCLGLQFIFGWHDIRCNTRIQSWNIIWSLHWGLFLR